MEVFISLQGVDKAMHRWQRVENRLTDLTPVWPEVSALILAAERRGYGKRAKLKDSTVQRKQQAGRPEPLVRTGALKRALTEPEAEHAIRETTPSSLTFGTDLYYTRFLKRYRRNLLKFTPTARRSVSSLILTHILREP